MDRTAWIAISLSVVGLFATQWYLSTYTDAPTAPALVAATPSPTPALAATPEMTPRPAPTMAARAESLVAPEAEFVFNNDAGGIETVVLLMHKGEMEERVSLNRDRGMPIGALGFVAGEVIGGFEMSMNAARREATFHRTEPSGLEITKKFQLPQRDDKANAYRVKMDVTFRNSGTTELQVPTFFVSTGGAAPIHVTDLPIYTRFDWAADGKMSNIDVNWFSAGTIPILGIPTHPERPLYSETRPAVEWAAVTSQYFCTIISASTDKPASAVWAKRFDTKKQNNTAVFGIQGGLGSGGFSLPPGATMTRTFDIYAGPKELSRLRAIGGTQDHAMNFGMFGIVSEILLWGMISLHGVLGSYAAAIIVLTLIIKSGLWPIQNKATFEMRKMAALSPKMTEVREKFKDDPQKMNEEVMKLYKEYGVNPFSGCFPMLIQIPIFFGFYAMLGTAIELRNSSFLWITDLSQPDTVSHILGFPINVLPLVMAGTMVWQMAITPKTGDVMQQRLLYFMPIVFLVFCYNYASGLALYWTTQNAFSIVQLYLTRNKPLPTLEKKTVIAKREQDALKKQKRKKKP